MTTTTNYTAEAQELLGGFVQRAGKSITSGLRTLAGLSGDWRPVSNLADIALGWFKRVNIEGMRRAARKIGLTPRF